MSTYFIGDIHGCYKYLQSILNLVHFNPKIDNLYLTGDLVARGPQSLEVLRLIHKFNKHAHTVLGNHDLHLLKTYLTKNTTISKDFNLILNAPDADELINWLRHQPILYIDEEKKILMSHAGIHPYWNITQAKQYAKEIENILISQHASLILENNNKDKSINLHSFNFNKLKEIQTNINIFTRMRYVYLNGQLNMSYKNTPNENSYKKNIYPWFDIIKYIDSTYNIIFGHWASLKHQKIPSNIYGLDSGCCWGGNLTLLRWEDKKIIKIPCVPC